MLIKHRGLSESEKLENFKKEIWKEIDSMSWGIEYFGTNNE